ncbi:MAG: hypothetical protein ACRDL5_15600, partial [Solirubrobacteraceae bacterium]
MISPAHPRWPTRLTALVSLGAAAAVVLLLVACGSDVRARAATEITGARVGRPIPSGFLGLSIEIKSLEQYAGSDPAALDPVFLRLIEQIAPGQSPVLRFGGDSTDWSWWPVAGMKQPPGIRYTLTPTWISVARALAAQLHAKLILGVNLEADSAKLASVEARAMVSGIGRGAIAALELGNEPELYGVLGWYHTKSGRQIRGRPRSYDLADFISQYTQFARRMPAVPLAGPSSGAPTWLSMLGRFLSAEPRVRLVTVHAYPLKHCTKSTVVTIPQLLSESSSHGLAQLLAPYLEAAARAGAPLRVDEMNGISCGGTKRVSNSFASALWVLDTLFELARAGVSGVNIHTVPGTTNEILGPARVAGQWQMRVHPEYYGMIMFAQATPPGSRLLALRSPAPAGVKIWATRARDGAIHVVVINKR